MQGPSSLPILPGAALRLAGEGAPALRTGEVLRAEVTGNDRHFSLIRIGGRVIEALADVPLRTGDILHLKVERQGDHVLLRIIDAAKPAGAAAQARPTAALADSLPGIPRNLLALLSSLPPQVYQRMPELEIIRSFLLSGLPRSGDALKKLIDDSGLFLEEKLRLLAAGQGSPGALDRDLKAALLRALDGLRSADGQNVFQPQGSRAGDLTTLLDGLLRSIAVLQQQATMTGSLQFLLPFSGENVPEGFLLFRRSDRQDRQDVFSCTIALDLERLGKMRIDAVCQGELLQVHVSAQQEGSVRLLQMRSQDLESRFSSAGLRLRGITVRHEDPLELTAGPAGGVSVKA